MLVLSLLRLTKAISRDRTSYLPRINLAMPSFSPHQSVLLLLPAINLTCTPQHLMDADEDFEIDPAIAAAMGFGAFGAQKSQKRKFNANDGFVDPSVGKPEAAHGTGANSMPMQDRKEKPARVMSQDAPKLVASASSSHAQKSSLAAYDPQTQDSPSLEALKFGVRNIRGDMVYFSKSFLEDPWAGLKPE